MKSMLLFYLMRAFHQGLFFPIGPIWTRLSPMNFVFNGSLTCWKTVADKKPSSRGLPRIWWGWGAYPMSTLRMTLGKERQRLYESFRGRARQGYPRTTKTTMGRRFLSGYCFSTCLKIVADHFSVCLKYNKCSKKQDNSQILINPFFHLYIVTVYFVFQLPLSKCTMALT